MSETIKCDCGSNVWSSESDGWASLGGPPNSGSWILPKVYGPARCAICGVVMGENGKRWIPEPICGFLGLLIKIGLKKDKRYRLVYPIKRVG